MTDLVFTHAGMIPFFSTAVDNCATWIYTWPELANQGNVPDYPLTETPYVFDSSGTPTDLTSYTQKVYNVYPPGGGSDYFSSAIPTYCSQTTTTIVIYQIPTSVVDELTARVSAGGDAYGGVYGWLGKVRWQLYWNGYRAAVEIEIVSSFEGTIFDPLPRSLDIQVAWTLSLNGVNIFTSGGLVAGSTHPMAGTYTYTTDSLSYGEMGYTYITSLTGMAVGMENVFGTVSIETSTS